MSHHPVGAGNGSVKDTRVRIGSRKSVLCFCDAAAIANWTIGDMVVVRAEQAVILCTGKREIICKFLQDILHKSHIFAFPSLMPFLDGGQHRQQPGGGLVKGARSDESPLPDRLPIVILHNSTIVVTGLADCDIS
jgi:hypothetical protein